ncbi:MAG: DEAD/DEAH box helicase [Planctomycetota bacterium]|nr:DEAD/DEAH box helicase [Planctomycetota bacterium]
MGNKPIRPRRGHQGGSRPPPRRRGPKGKKPGGSGHVSSADAHVKDTGSAKGINISECAFSQFNLRDDLLSGIARAGYRDPSPIQAKGIPPALEGRDIIGQARTGTGKTAAFAVPALQNLTDRKGPRVLVVVPTRELAMQVARETARLGHHMGLKVAAIYGGAPMDKQLEALKKGAQFLVGTPGRLLDHLERGTIRPVDLDMLILDEADRMFDLGFRDDIAKIMKASPKRGQTMLFSATLSEEVLRLSARYMKDPVRVIIHTEKMTVDEVEQFFYAVAPNRKRSLLFQILKTENPELGIIFTRTKIGADKLARALQDKNIDAREIHSDLSQRRREQILDGFRKSKFRFLVATDVAARGLDIPDVSHVFNYDIPNNSQDYVHRIGRTARMGRKGWAATFVCPDDGEYLTEIEKLINQQISYASIEGFDNGIESVERNEDGPDLQKEASQQYRRTIHGDRRSRGRK